MHIPRFFLTSDDLRIDGSDKARPLDLEQGQPFDITSKVVLNQVANVLRMRADDRLVVLDGAGRLYRCHIERIESKAVCCRVDIREVATGDPSVEVTVALALLKGDRFEWCLQKLTELGVKTVVPLVTARTVVKVDTSTTGDAKGTNNKVARWQAIMREAAEQSERGMIPHIVAPRKVEDFISSCTGGGKPFTAFICAERLSTTPLRDILLDQTRDPSVNSATTQNPVNLIIGPEGGFTEDEIVLAEKRGIKPVSLGPRILRSETAAIFALAQVILLLEK